MFNHMVNVGTQLVSPVLHNILLLDSPHLKLATVYVASLEFFFFMFAN